MNATQAAEQLKEKGIEVQPSTITKWIRLGYLPGEKVGKSWDVYQEDLETALRNGTIPPRPGRPGRYSMAEKARMAHMRDAHGLSLSEIAAQMGCDQSYVSLVVRGLR